MSSTSSPAKGLRTYSFDRFPMIPERNTWLPNYWQIWPALIGYAWAIWYFDVWPYFLAWYCIYPFISPFGAWSLGLKYFFKMFTKFEGYSWSFNFVTLFGVLFSRLIFLWPFETILWYMDDIFFPAYKKTQVEKPLFLIGQPRSGTTKLEEILSEDSDNLLALRLFEMRFPYLTVQYAMDFLIWADKKYLHNVLRAIFVDRLKWNYKWGSEGERHQMRRLRYDLHDEDDIIFLFHQMHHFQLIGFLPSPDMVSFFHHFDHLHPNIRRRAMLFHRSCVQKVLYRRGNGRRYFAKWVAGWNGQLDEARVVYPDAQFLVIVRNPEESLPSWFKLLSLLSIDMSGEDFMARPKQLEQVKKENVIWFKNEIEFCKTVPPRSLFMVLADEFYRDIPGNVRKIYRHFGREIVLGSHFDKFLEQQQMKQASHQKTKTDETHITVAEIKKFPDLVQEFFPLANVLPIQRITKLS